MQEIELTRERLIDLLDRCLILAWEAGERIMAVYQRGFRVDTKIDDSPVTEADMGAHEVVVDGLQSLPRAWPVLSEESVDIPFSARSQWQRYWLVDPLDGTREFIKRNGEFTVNIALIEGQESVLGVIYAPVLDRYYYAAKGCGAYTLDGEGKPRRIRTRKADPAHLVIAGSRSHATARFRQFLDRVGSYELLSVGSSLKSCRVAEGSADVYARLGPTSEWDTAAAQCIVEEAGGYFTDIHGQRLHYNSKESVLNPEFLVYGDGDFDWLRFVPPEDG